MNLNVRSQNCHFPFTSLPTVVIHHIAQYLNRSDLENMAQVNRYLRKVFNTPRLWKDVRIRLLAKKTDPQALEILRVRGVTDLDVCNVMFDLQIATLARLERLSLHVTRSSTLEVLFKAASNGHLYNLKSLAFGDLDYKIGHKSRVTFLSLFQSLPMMEEVSFGHDSSFIAHQKICVPLTTLTDETKLAVDLKQALCYSGKLTSISLICFGKVGKSWLNTVMINNPHMRSLSLYHIKSFAEEGFDGAADPTVCSSLRTFKLSVPCLSKLNCYSKAANKVLSWAFPGNKPNENVTSLELSNSYVSCESTIFPLHDKFPALKKLSLTNSVTLNNFSYFSLQGFPDFQKLEWLEIKHSTIMGKELGFLSEKVGKTLNYLNLPRQDLIKDGHLRDLAGMFPALRTLDLSQCSHITDAILVEWYIKHNKSELWPKLRKLVLKDCREITQEVVDSVRLKTRNQLLIDL